MAKKRKRITFDETPASLNDAFGSLGFGGLAAGPAADESRKEIPTAGTLYVRRETAHRGGKSVIIVSEFSSEYPDFEIASLAKNLKQHCGCGGAVKDREIILQGEQAKTVNAYLQQQGFRLKGVKE